MAQGQRGGPGGLLSYFTRHGTAANLLMVIMLVAGLAALPRMRAQFFPDIIVERISVSTGWQGAGAEDVDSAIVQLLEPALLAVEGVENTASTSREGGASISLEFQPGWDMARAAEDVQNAIDGIGNLPSDADDPEVRRSNWRDPVTDVVITGPVGLEQLGLFADEMVTRLFAEGVTKTTVRGLAAPETIIEVPGLSLIRNDVTLAEIAAAIAAEAEADPAGQIASGAARVRTGSAKHSAAEIAAIVLRSNPDGSKLTIGEVADIRVEGVDRNEAFFVGPNPAMTISVQRSETGDAIEIQQTVAEVAAELEATLSAGSTVRLVGTQAEAISDRLRLLLVNAAMGLALVVALLVLFLNTRTALWVALGIPVSMSAAIGLMYLFGITFNMISLFALIITLGIVVDDAIVVGEHADFRSRRLRENPTEAAENAARRMFQPVFSATITTIIAFFGLVIIGGRFGTLIADIPFTVSVVLAASLFECFVILPHHMRLALAHAGQRHWYDLPSRVVNVGFSWFREVVFRRVIRVILWARYPVLAAAVVLLISQVAVFVRGDLQFRFFSAPEQGTVSGNFAMAPGATREDSMAMMRELQRAVDEVATNFEAEYGTNPVTHVMAQIGGNSGRGLAGADTKESWQLGGISVELIGADDRPYSSNTFVTALQEAIRNHPMAETVSFRGYRGGPGGDSLSVDLYGADAPRLKAAAEALKGILAQYPEVSALEDSLAYDKDELILELKPQGLAMGLTTDALGAVLRDRLNGIEAARYPVGARSAAIRVMVPQSELTADFLDRMKLRTGSGDYVNLADVVSVVSRSGFSTVRRENGLRLVGVTGDISEDDPARATEINRALAEDILPKLSSDFGVTWNLSGLAEQEREFLNDALISFLLCILGIFLTLAWIFASWTRPVVVMAIIPFGLIGAIWGHVYWEVPMSMFSIVGLIGMTGIIINDSIVLISTVDEYARDRGLFPAIVDAVADRLRPVFLTTATTVLGLAPLLFERSEDAQFLKPTVITLVYGLGFGMVLVLFLVPAILGMQSDFRRQFAALRKAMRLRRRVRGVQVPVLAGGLLVALAFAVILGSGLFGWTPTGWIGALVPQVSGPLSIALFAAVSGAALLVVYFFSALAVAFWPRGANRPAAGGS